LVALLQRDGENIYRFKGILSISGYDEQFIMHGVHMIFNGEKGGLWKPNQKRISKIVFIGVNLNADELDQHFTNCRASLLSTKLIK
jgi:G3E family GTPase